MLHCIYIVFPGDGVCGGCNVFVGVSSGPADLLASCVHACVPSTHPTHYTHTPTHPTQYTHSTQPTHFIPPTPHTPPHTSQHGLTVTAAGSLLPALSGDCSQ